MNSSSSASAAGIVPALPNGGADRSRLEAGRFATMNSICLFVGGLLALIVVLLPFVLNLLALRWRRIFALAGLSFKEALAPPRPVGLLRPAARLPVRQLVHRRPGQARRPAEHLRPARLLGHDAAAAVHQRACWPPSASPPTSASRRSTPSSPSRSSASRSTLAASSASAA